MSLARARGMPALRAAILARPQRSSPREGTQVRYVRTTFLPDDETCFHVFEAVSEEVVAEVFRRAGIVSGRIVSAVE